MAKGKYKYWRSDDGLLLLRAWARNGLTLEQVAKNMKVSRSTLMLWLNKFTDIHDALKENARACADFEVENSMRERALGKKEKLMKPIKVRRVEYENGKKLREWEEVVYAEEEVYIPADTMAGIFWLNNRKPEDWRNKREAPPSNDPPPDDGFINALNEKAPEVMSDGGDIPQDVND